MRLLEARIPFWPRWSRPPDGAAEPRPAAAQAAPVAGPGGSPGARVVARPFAGGRFSTILRRTIITGALGTGIAFAGFHLSQPPGATRTWKTEPVKRRELVRDVTASGPLAPAVKAELRSPVAGTVTRVDADFGSEVAAGQPLAQIDTATYELALRDARTTLDSARAAVEVARHRVEQCRTLKKEGLIPLTDYEKATSEFHQARAAERIAESAVSRARMDVERCTIRSPLKGVVITRSVNDGQSVDTRSDSAPLFVIAGDLAKMRIEANVAESDIGEVRPGMAASFTVDAFPDTTFEGTVTQVRAVPIVDQTVVSYPVIVDVVNEDLRLKPGMTASVAIVLEKRDNVLAIPSKALRFRPDGGKEGGGKEGGGKDGGARDDGGRPAGGDGKATVYRLVPAEADGDDGRGTLERLSITTGLSDGRRIEVLSGLREGDRLVVGAASRDEDDGLLARLPDILSGRVARRKDR